jgi:hypothetical protein
MLAGQTTELAMWNTIINAIYREFIRNSISGSKVAGA